MSILFRYMFLRMVGPLVVALVLLTGMIWILQLLRLGHTILGSDIQLALLGQLLLYSLPSLLIFAFPLGLAAALLLSLGRMAETNELLAMRVQGASPLRLALPSTGLCLAVAMVTWLLAAHVERPALHALQDLLGRQAVRVLLLSARPGRFVPISGEATLYVAKRLDSSEHRARFEGLFFAQRRPRTLLWARQATIEPRKDQTVTLKLQQGELHQNKANNRLRRIRFERLEQELDLGPAVRRHLGFLTDRADSGQLRAVAAPSACLALGFLCTAIGLGLSRRLPMAGLGIAAVASYQAAVWAVGLWGHGPLGVVLISTGVVFGCLLVLARWSRRRASV